MLALHDAQRIAGNNHNFLFMVKLMRYRGYSRDDQRSRFSGRLGFTLVELLVVIAIIGVLVSLLLPAVQAARESSRRSQCANNSRNVAIALISYHDANNRFPAAISLHPKDDVGEDNGRPTTLQTLMPNWAVMILPYLEQASAYASLVTMNPSNASEPVYMSDDRNRTVRSAALSVMRCGSDFANEPFSDASTGDNWARGNYAINGFQMAPAFYNHPTMGWKASIPRKGIAGINAALRMGDITDGSSNTVMIGEIRAGLATMDSRGAWALGACGSSVLCLHASHFLLSPNSCTPGDDDVNNAGAIIAAVGADALKMECMYPYEYGASNQAGTRSQHPGGVNVAMADASVRFIDNYVETGVAPGVFEYDAGYPNSFGVWQRLNLSQDELPVNVPN